MFGCYRIRRRFDDVLCYQSVNLGILLFFWKCQRCKNGLNVVLVKKHKKSWDKSHRNELWVIAKLKLCVDITSMVWFTWDNLPFDCESYYKAVPPHRNWVIYGRLHLPNRIIWNIEQRYQSVWTKAAPFYSRYINYPRRVLLPKITNLFNNFLDKKFQVKDCSFKDIFRFILTWKTYLRKTIFRFSIIIRQYQFRHQPRRHLCPKSSEVISLWTLKHPIAQ